MQQQSHWKAKHLSVWLSYYSSTTCFQLLRTEVQSEDKKSYAQTPSKEPKVGRGYLPHSQISLATELLLFCIFDKNRRKKTKRGFKSCSSFIYLLNSTKIEIETGLMWYYRNLITTQVAVVCFSTNYNVANNVIRIHLDTCICIFMLMVKAIPGEKVHDMIALKSNMKTLTCIGQKIGRGRLWKLYRNHFQTVTIL